MIEQEYLAFAAAFQAEHREMRRLVQVLRHALGKPGGWSRESAEAAFEAFEALKAQPQGTLCPGRRRRLPGAGFGRGAALQR